MSVSSQASYKGFERAFCVRMKSTLTKRGCHFKSSGYRVSIHTRKPFFSLHIHTFEKKSTLFAYEFKNESKLILFRITVDPYRENMISEQMIGFL